MHVWMDRGKGMHMYMGGGKGMHVWMGGGKGMHVWMDRGKEGGMGGQNNPKVSALIIKAQRKI